MVNIGGFDFILKYIEKVCINWQILANLLILTVKTSDNYVLNIVILSIEQIQQLIY
jgi:hypothetical protein